MAKMNLPLSAALLASTLLVISALPTVPSGHDERDVLHRLGYGPGDVETENGMKLHSVFYTFHNGEDDVHGTLHHIITPFGKRADAGDWGDSFLETSSGTTIDGSSVDMPVKASIVDEWYPIVCSKRNCDFYDFFTMPMTEDTLSGTENSKDLIYHLTVSVWQVDKTHRIVAFPGTQNEGDALVDVELYKKEFLSMKLQQAFTSEMNRLSPDLEQELREWQRNECGVGSDEEVLQYCIRECEKSCKRHAKCECDAKTEIGPLLARIPRRTWPGSFYSEVPAVCIPYFRSPKQKSEQRFPSGVWWAETIIDKVLWWKGMKQNVYVNQLEALNQKIYENVRKGIKHAFGGFSLGGALAHISSIYLFNKYGEKIPSIARGAPGTAMAAMNLPTDFKHTQDHYDWLINVIPNIDPIPHIDNHMGEVCTFVPKESKSRKPISRCMKYTDANSILEPYANAVDGISLVSFATEKGRQEQIKELSAKMKKENYHVDCFMEGHNWSHDSASSPRKWQCVAGSKWRHAQIQPNYPYDVPRRISRHLGPTGTCAWSIFLSWRCTVQGWGQLDYNSNELNAMATRFSSSAKQAGHLTDRVNMVLLLSNFPVKHAATCFWYTKNRNKVCGCYYHPTDNGEKLYLLPTMDSAALLESYRCDAYLSSKQMTTKNMVVPARGVPRSEGEMIRETMRLRELALQADASKYSVLDTDFVYRELEDSRFMRIYTTSCSGKSYSRPFSVAIGQQYVDTEAVKLVVMAVEDYLRQKGTLSACVSRVKFQSDGIFYIYANTDLIEEGDEPITVADFQLWPLPPAR